MHRDHRLRAQLTKRLQGLLGIHVHIPFRGRFIGTDRQQSELDVDALSDLFESIKISGVSTVKNRPSRVLDEKTSESSVTIVQNSCSPVASRGEGYF